MARNQSFLPFEPPVSNLALLTAPEIYQKADSSLLALLAEDRRIERKPVGIHADHLGVYFSMWANSPTEGGLIAVGIEDDGEITDAFPLARPRSTNLKRRDGRSAQKHGMKPSV